MNPLPSYKKAQCPKWPTKSRNPTKIYPRNSQGVQRLAIDLRILLTGSRCCLGADPKIVHIRRWRIARRPPSETRPGRGPATPGAHSVLRGGNAQHCPSHDGDTDGYIRREDRICPGISPVQIRKMGAGTLPSPKATSKETWLNIRLCQDCGPLGPLFCGPPILQRARHASHALIRSADGIFHMPTRQGKN
jgi:hypothetical protein